MTERELIAFFEDIHAHPELGFEERRTTAKVLEVLNAHGVTVLSSGLETGVIAQVGKGETDRVIGLRCDMDALPIQEESNLPYASLHAGKMHACGHDFHTSCMLQTALLLKARESEIHGLVKIVFQPAEEIANGAKRVLATGLLQNVREFYGIHSYPWFPVGTLGIKEGPVMAAPDRFVIRLLGKGAHGAEPHHGIDPIVALGALIQSTQTIVSRTLNPFSPALVSITHVEAGNTWNVIPECAIAEGTVRTLNSEDRAHIEASLRRIANGVAEAHGCTAEFEWHEGSPAVINDPSLCAEARALALEMGFQAERQENTMGGEDFSEYLQYCPGVFIRVGTGGAYASHHPKFTVDPAALQPAAKFFAELAIRRVNAK